MIDIRNTMTYPHIELLRQNDSQTWEEIYSVWGPYYTGIIHVRWNRWINRAGLTGRFYARGDRDQVKHDVETIFHNTLMTFYNLLKHDRFTWESAEKTKRYVYNIACNETRNALRGKIKLIDTIPLEDYHQPPSSGTVTALSRTPQRSFIEYCYDKKELFYFIREIIDNEFSSKHAEIVRRYWWYGENYEPIAEACNITVESARNIIWEARKKLTNRLSDILLNK